jgi:hypothetical protein
VFGVSINGDGSISASDTVTASGGNSGNWNTAYGWGDHASAGYLKNDSGLRDKSYMNLSFSTSSDDPNTTTSAWFLSNNANAPFGSIYAHIQNYTWSGSGGNRSQIATSYNGDASQMATRHLYSGTWTPWRKVAYTDSNISGNAATASKVTHASSRTDSATYPVLWGVASSTTHAYSCAAVTIQSSTGTVNATNFKTADGGNIGAVTGNYGSINVTGAAGSSGGYAGVSVNNRIVLMNNAASSGLYNDMNNHWFLYCIENGESGLHHAGVKKGYTYGSGWRVTGNMLATSNVYAYYSDERLKDVVGAIEEPLESVKAIRTFYYTHNDKARELGYEGSERQVGVSAQSVQAVMPEVIGRAPIDDDGEGGSVTGEDYVTVQYERLVPLLIESIKTLADQVEGLQEQINAIQ